MNKVDSNFNTEKNSQRKGERGERRPQYRESFIRVFQRLHRASWLQSGTTLLVGFVPGIIGICMGTVKGTVYGVAATLTLFIWVIAFLLVREVQSEADDKNQQTNSQPQQINAPNGIVNSGVFNGPVTSTVTNSPAPRTVSKEQASTIEAGIAHGSGSVYFLIDNSADNDANDFADSIGKALSSKYVIIPDKGSGQFNPPAQDISVVQYQADQSEAERIIDSLLAADIPAKGAFKYSFIGSSEPPPNSIVIIIGRPSKKP